MTPDERAKQIVDAAIERGVMVARGAIAKAIRDAERDMIERALAIVKNNPCTSQGCACSEYTAEDIRKLVTGGDS